MRAGDRRAAIARLHTRALQRAAIGIFKPRDFLVLRRLQRREIEADVFCAPTKTARILKIVTKAACIDIELFRHTAADDTGATHPAFFGKNNFRAITGRDTGGTHAA